MLLAHSTNSDITSPVSLPALKLMSVVVNKGLVLIQSNGVIVTENAFARQLLNQRDGIFVDGGIFNIDQSLGNQSIIGLCDYFENYYQNKATSFDVAPSYELIVNRKESEHPFRIVAQSFVSHINNVKDLPLILLTICNPDADIDVPEQYLATAFKLTKQEINVVHMFTCHHDLPIVAEKLNLKLSTVQQYTKSIFKKMNISKQCELLKVVSNLATNNGVFIF